MHQPLATLTLPAYEMTLAATPAMTLFPPRDDQDLLRAARLATLAFNLPAGLGETWLRGAGPEHVRLLGDPSAPAGALPASLLRIPMGHYFGGRPVTTMGTAGVAVAPEQRGQGVGRQLIRAFLDEARDEGFALSSLFASTVSFYRTSGYELAGHHFEYVVPLALLPSATRSGHTLVPLQGVDERVRACHAAFAAQTNGSLDRGPYVWSRVQVLRGEPFDGYGVLDPQGALVAYAFVAQRRNSPVLSEVDLAVTDLAFLTAEAGATLLAFFKSFGTIAKHVRFTGGPMHPLVALLPHKQFTATRVEYWMLRVLRPELALTQRGYPRHTSATLVLDLEDPFWPDQAGAWTLEVSGGAGTVKRGARSGAPMVACGPRGLAALFTGFLSPFHARLAGLLRGSDDALATAQAVFAGTPPSCSDFF